MKFITEQQTLVKEFERLCNQYCIYKFAVAWAGDPFNMEKVLWKNKKRIKRMVVGLHFYQTSPDFIEKYLEMDAIRYIKQTDGTFHTKIYLFYNSENDWEVLVGSSNFTDAGFNHNYEANILISSEDNNKSCFFQINSFIESLWNEAAPFKDAELDNYRQCWEKQKVRIAYSKKNSYDRRVFETRIFDMMSWDEYIDKMTNLEDRADLLSEAHSILSKATSFRTISLNDKRCLAGLISKRKDTDDGMDWYTFGSMNRVAKFKYAIESNDSDLAEAVDSIPIKGEVKKSDYNKYKRLFIKSTKMKKPLAAATRLLALKRPDIFVCIDGKNKKRLCEKYGITEQSLTLDTYWDFIKRIHESLWFKEESTSVYKKFQVALLDCIYYYD